MADNPFYVKNGFKLNLQKRLIMAYGTYPKNYEDCDGTLVSLNNFVNHFTFNDDSQRIIRYINGQYVLENPDLSTEIYDTWGKIIAIKDKYDSEYLSYTYTSGKLTSINYRNSKYINLLYYTEGSYVGQLERIDFVCGETSVSSTFIYSNSGIKIQHYSGMDYHFVFSGNTLTSYSTDRNGAYSNVHSHKLICALDAANHKIIASAYIGEKEVDRNTYDCLCVNSQNKFIAVNIKDFNGVITRVQYENDKPCYSYEITDIVDELPYENIFFEDANANMVYKGNVSINTDTFSGVQGVNDGCKMRDISIDNISAWNYVFSGSGSLYGNFIISGWIYGDENKTYAVTVRDTYRSIDYEGCTLSNLVPNVWNYFFFKTYMRNPADITVKITETSGIPVCFDVRISFEEGKIYSPTEFNNFTITKDVLIKEGTDSSNEKIIYFDNALRFYNGNKLITDRITASDILKYKINQNKNRHISELYYDKCKGVSTSSGVFALEYDEDVNGVIQTTRLDVNDIAVGKARIHNEKTYLTKMNFYTDSNGDSYLATVTYINGEEIGRETFDEFFDIASSTIDSVTTTYQRTNGLITCESVQNLYTRTTTYSEDAGENPTITAKDEFDNTTIYTLDPVWGVVKSTLMPNGTVITDEYDSDMCAVVARTFTDSDGNSKTHTFEYAAGNLAEITDSTVNYNFTYSAGALSEVFKFDTTPIEKHILSNGDMTITSCYPKESGALYSIVQNTDKYGRLNSVEGIIDNTYDINPVCSDSGVYTKAGIDNGSSKLAISKDLTTGNETKYAYENSHIKKVGVFNSSRTKISEEELTYDAAGRIATDAFTYNNMSNSVQSDITYATEENSPTADGRVSACSYKVNGIEKAKTQNRYNDNYKRLTAKLVMMGGYTYDKGFTYSQTRISKVMDVKNGSKFHNVSYEYDAMGRIVGETDSVDTSFKNTYVYDTFGQLIRENNKSLDKTFVYEYDNIGNITSVKTYGYTTDDISGDPTSEDSFTYHSTVKDRLTKFNNLSISYDSNGCPTSYNGKTYTWTKGRLTSVSSGTLPYSVNTYTYVYDAYGRRTQKNQSTVSLSGSTPSNITINTKYDYDSSGRIIRETTVSSYTVGNFITTEKLYLYDESGVIGMIYTANGTSSIYYFDRNIRGDVIGIFDSTGTRVVKYSYDSWGNCTISSTTNSTIANANPFRYRGYYYDAETGLYYLNARYYNPEWRRFISPDDTSYLDPESVNGLNLYAYCYNDPVNYADPSGHDPEWWQWVLSGLSLAAGVACCIFVPGGQVFGVGLIVNGASGLIANTMDLMGVDGKTASIISAGLSIVSGIALCCIPIGGIAAFAGIGAGLIGQGVGSIAGGYISEALGGSFELGSTLGGIAGSIAGGFTYRGIMSYKFSHMTAYQKGAYAEKYVKAIYGNKVFKPTTGANRPDLLFKNGSALIEVKNVASQSLTNQLNRYLNLGYGTNIIYLRVGTRVSSALKASSYVIKYLPW